MRFLFVNTPEVVMPLLLVITRLRCIVHWHENSPYGFENHLVKKKTFSQGYQEEFKKSDLRMFP